ncbi:hypothetical protein LXL04_028484 [Taraxacum kok-saghyz]
MGICFSSEYDAKQCFQTTKGEFGPHGNKAICASTIAPRTIVITKDVKSLRKNPAYGNLDVFTYEEMQIATKAFRPDQVLGVGGFGIVYKGVIDENVRPFYSKIQVAIKQLDPEGIQGDKEWLAEVNYLGQLQHPNLVKLIGYCCEEHHRASVILSWSKRIKIALDAAKGLDFLHDAECPIIYRDFKTSNILLDREFNAKLSDFGLAKDGPMGDDTHVSTRVMGTYGYAAPEYISTGHLTTRSDIYGFGVVLLEMLIGRKSIDTSRPSHEHNLVDWARPLLTHDKKLLKILDPRMEGQYSSKEAIKVANLAHQCISPNPKDRPTMGQVVEMLRSLQTNP